MAGFCLLTMTTISAADAGTASPPGDYPLIAPLMDDLRERRDGDAVFAAVLDGVVAGMRQAMAGT